MLDPKPIDISERIKVWKDAYLQGRIDMAHEIGLEIVEKKNIAALTVVDMMMEETKVKLRESMHDSSSECEMPQL